MPPQQHRYRRRTCRSASGLLLPAACARLRRFPSSSRLLTLLSALSKKMDISDAKPRVNGAMLAGLSGKKVLLVAQVRGRERKERERERPLQKSSVDFRNQMSLFLFSFPPPPPPPPASIQQTPPRSGQGGLRECRDGHRLRRCRGESHPEPAARLGARRARRRVCRRRPRRRRGRGGREGAAGWDLW